MAYNLENILAKSQKNGKISLIEHSKSVINVSKYLFDTLVKKDISFNNIRKETVKKFYNELILTAALHDIGKCSLNFQRKINNFVYNEDGNSVPSTNKERDKFIHHNVSGWAYLEYYGKAIPEIVKNNILYHHTTESKIGDKTVLEIVTMDDMLESKEFYDLFYDEILSYCNKRLGTNFDKNLSDDGQNENKTIDSVSLYQQIIPNSPKFFNMMDDGAKYLIIRAIVVYADRFVSNHYQSIDKILEDNITSINFLNEHITKNILDGNDEWQDNVNELLDDKGEHVYDINRLVEQNKLLDEIDKNDNNIVSASAGFGKTLVGLRWIIRNKKKTMWVVPRNVIAMDTYRQVCYERTKIGYNENNLNVGLLIGGEWLFGSMESDIIVTNIDNFLSMMIKNCMVGNLIKEIGGNIIFDEYHEFLCNEPLFAGFIELVYTRCKFTNSKTLLLSATPLRFDKVYFNDNNKTPNISFVKAESFNGDMKVKINYLDITNISNLSLPKYDSFIICNTVKQSQDVFRQFGNKETDNLIHSRFPQKRRDEIEKIIYEKHGKNSNVDKRNNIFGTNIIGVGLDISAKNIYDFVITPENTIQRGCGRGGRFAEKEYNNEINYTICNLSNDRGNIITISKQISQSLHSKWLQILKEKDGETIKKDDMYEFYNRFYTENMAEVHTLWNEFLHNSSVQLRKLRPYKVFAMKEKSSNKLTNRLSYRGEGNSIYVVTCDGNNISEPIIVNCNYICQEEFVKIKNKRKYFKECITASSNKYKAKILPISKEEMFSQARYEKTPLLLEYSTYDDIYGLNLNSLKKNYIEDDEID